jgi:hypothetical protein
VSLLCTKPILCLFHSTDESAWILNNTVRKMSDGMFLSACRQVSNEFPDVAYDEDLLDRVCLQVRVLPSLTFRLAEQQGQGCAKSQTVFGSCHGDAQLVWGHPLGHVCRPYRRSGTYTFG